MPTKTMEELNGFIASQITWYGHASFKITSQSDAILYLDPVSLPGDLPLADIILVTHEHYDHFDQKSIASLLRHTSPETLTIVPEGMAQIGLKGLAIGGVLEFGPFKITGVPAYNPEKKFHPQSNHWLGYIVEVDGVKVYHAGDTDYIPEMKNLAPDIALLPVGGTYTMNPEEAVEAALAMGAKIVVPMHFGAVVGEKEDGIRFAALFKAGQTKIMTPER